LRDVALMLVVQEREAFQDSVFKDAIHKVIFSVVQEPRSVWYAVFPVAVVVKVVDGGDFIATKLAEAIRFVAFPLANISDVDLPVNKLKILEAIGNRPRELALAVCLAGHQVPFVD